MGVRSPPTGCCFEFLGCRWLTSGEHYTVVNQANPRADEPDESGGSSDFEDVDVVPSLRRPAAPRKPMLAMDAVKGYVKQQAGLEPINVRRWVEGATPSGQTLPSRVNFIFDTWEVRGAKRPMTDFYTYVDKLGEGAYGEVQRWSVKSGVDLGSGFETCVAVKHIKWTYVWNGASRSKEPERLRLIRNELKMLLVLDNPFIVKCREWFEQACTGISFVMELCQGASLQTLLEDACKLDLDGRMKLTTRFRRYFRETAYAVSYIHNLDPPVVHRDLKPDNILLKHDHPNSPVKIIDFGLACLRAHSGDNGIFQQGTLPFMAPEQFLSSTGDITQENDNWALGVIFAWIVTALQLGSMQHPLVDRESGVDFSVRWIDLYYACRDKTPWNRELFLGQPEEAFSLADGILVHDPTVRMTSSDILRHDWVRSGDPTAAAAAQILSNGSIVNNLLTYQDLSVLDKKLLSLAAEYAPDLETQMLRRTFRAFDKENHGRICMRELVEGFRENAVELPGETVEAIFSSVDQDGSGSIEYHEWLGSTLDPRILQSEQTIRSAFQGLDIAGAGHLTRHELQKLLGEEETALILESLHVTDADDECSFKDFRRLMKEVSKRRESLSLVPKDAQRRKWGRFNTVAAATRQAPDWTAEIFKTNNSSSAPVAALS